MAEHILLSGGAKIIPIEVKSEGYNKHASIDEFSKVTQVHR